MRHVLPLLLALVATPAAAQFWDSGIEDGLCTLYSTDAGQSVVITYDPALPLYTLTVTRDIPWPDAPGFGIAFTGGQELTITTNRQAYAEDGRSLIVSDRGFGNVLLGLARNTDARFFSGPDALLMALDGAAEAVADFVACQTVPTA